MIIWFPFAVNIINYENNDLCKYAVVINGLTLEFVKHSCVEINKIALTKNGF